jgi:hypothetical protein
MSCRLRYLESAFLSTASLVYNVVMSALFGVATLITFGQVKMVMDQMSKHWTHSALATAALGISTIGTFSPTLGVKANAAGLFGVGLIVSQWMQGDLLSKVGDAYQKHRQELKDATFIGVNRDLAFFNRDCAPLFHYLDANLNNQVQTFADLMKVVEGAQEFVPNVVPRATADVILDNIHKVVSKWSHAHTTSAVSTV